jgi:hypothetical protein
VRKIKIKMDCFAQAKAKSRANSRTCSQCPKFKTGQNWCPILGRITLAVNEACAYGDRLIMSQRIMKHIRRKGDGHGVSDD